MRAARLSGPAWWFVAGYAVSAIGTGLCYPFLAIYLHQLRGRSDTATALLLLLLAGVAVPVSVLGGRLVDRYAPRAVAIGALLVQAAGWVLLAAGADGPAMLVIGVGTGAFLPAVVPVIAGLSASEAVRARTMSMRYLLLNLGLGVGAGIGGLVLGPAGAPAFRWLCVANGVSCAVYALVLARRVPPVRAVRREERLAPFRPGYTFGLLLAAQLLLVTFGLAQVDSGVPLMVRGAMSGSTALVGGLYAVATLVVLVGQLPVARWVERVHKTRALIVMGLLWAGAWLLGWAAGALTGGARTALLFAMIVTFALGECAYSPAFYTLVERIAPAGTLGRSSGAAWAVFQLGNTIGPPIAVFLVGGPAPFWLVLAAAAALAAVLMLVVDRRMHAAAPPELNHLTPAIG
ncbi:MFS transporter [Dactylosporangium sp. McL0621]|uniref:MFS transporter n=1 Tax=Dactylosporangium sp. McL0621 TaxID=3415678 RepID=UPI003CE783D5